VHSAPSLHDALFGTWLHPETGSHASSVHTFPSSHPPAVQAGSVVVVVAGIVVVVVVWTALIAARASIRPKPASLSNPGASMSTAVDVSTVRT